MKKALVIFILLAFVGSGLFAQTFSWNGHVEGGIAAMNLGASDDWTFGVVSPVAWANGARLQLQMIYHNGNENRAANAGFFTRFRATGAQGVGFQNAMQVQRAYAWMKIFNDMVELRGGRIWDDYMWANDSIGYGFSTWGTAYGVNAHIRPTDMITIALGARSNSLLSENATFEEGALGIWGGLDVNLPGTAIVRASMLHDDTQTNVMAFAKLTAVPAFVFDLVFMLDKLDEFGDFGLMYGYLIATYSGLSNIGVGVIAQFANSNQDAHEHPYLSFGGWLNYLMNDIQLGLNLAYTSGGTYSYNMGLTEWSPYYSSQTFNNKQSYFTIRPNIQVRATSAAQWNTGVVVNMELGDEGAAGGNKDNKVSFGVYTAVRLGF